MDIKIRPYQIGDEKQINDLYNKVFNRARTLKEWKWEFMDVPEGPSVIAVAEADGLIVGHLAVIPMKMTVGSIQLLGGKSENGMVDKKFRGRGVYRRIYGKILELCRERGVEIIWGCTAVMHAKKVGRKDIGYAKLCFTLVKPQETFRNLSGLSGKEKLKRILIVSTFPYSRVKRDFFLKRDSKLIIRKLKIGTIFDTFWRNYKKTTLFPSSIIISRTSHYLQWRIEKNLHFHFDVFGAFDKLDRMKGYIVLTANSKHEGWIEDIMIMNHNPEVLNELLSYSMSYFKRKKVGLVMTLISRIPNIYLEAFENHGFFIKNYSSHLVVADVSKNLKHKSIYNIEKWMLTNIYTEGILHRL